MAGSTGAQLNSNRLAYYCQVEIRTWGIPERKGRCWDREGAATCGSTSVAAMVSPRSTPDDQGSGWSRFTLTTDRWTTPTVANGVLPKGIPHKLYRILRSIDVREGRFATLKILDDRVLPPRFQPAVSKG